MEKNKRQKRQGCSAILALLFVTLTLTLTVKGLYSKTASKSHSFVIPRVIHKSLIAQDGNKSSKGYRNSFDSQWRYKWWTREDTRKLVIRNFAWLLDIYDRMPSDILRRELSKFLFLYSYGGVYMEDESESFLVSNSLLENKCVIVTVPENSRENDRTTNDLVAGVSFHPFFLSCIRKIIERFHRGIKTDERKLLDSKTLIELHEEWQLVRSSIYIESIEEPGIEASNSSLVAWEIDKFSTSKVVPCYEVSLVSKVSLL